VSMSLHKREDIVSMSLHKRDTKEAMKLQAYNIIQACLVTRSYIVKLGILLLISVTMHKGAQLPQPDPSDVSLQGKNVFLSCQ